MIIRNGGQGVELSGFTLVSADLARELQVELPAELADDLRCHLAEEGFRIPPGNPRSGVVEVVLAIASNPAVWAAAGGTLVAFLHRNRGKVARFEVEGVPVSIEGYSAAEVEKLAAALLENNRRRGTRKRSGTSPARQRPN